MNRKFSTIFIAVFLTFAFFTFAVPHRAAAQKPNGRAKKLAAEGDALAKQKDYRAAVNKYAEAVTASPNFPQAFFAKGAAHYFLNEYDAAVKDLTTALEQGYAPLEVYKLRWYSYKETKNYDAALKDIQAVLKADPKNTDFLMLSNLGEIYRGKNQCAEASDAFQKALAIKADNPDIYYFIADCAYQTGDTAKQKEAAENAVRKNTKYNAEANFLLGDALRKTRNFPEAAKAFERTLSLKPDYPKIYITLSEIYRNLNRLDDAVNIAKKGLLASDKDGLLYMRLSYFYSLSDRSKEAVAAGETATRLVPDKAQAFTNLCRAYNETKQYTLAVTACNKALSMTPNDGETLFYLGRSYKGLNKNDLALETSRQAIPNLIISAEADKTNGDNYYLLGNAYFDADAQIDKAIEAYKKSLELNPGFDKAIANLGFMYVISKNKAAALEQYDALLKISPPVAERLKKAIDGI